MTYLLIKILSILIGCPEHPSTDGMDNEDPQQGIPLGILQELPMEKE